MDNQDGVYNRRPWELTSQTLGSIRMDLADNMAAWTPPVPPQPEPEEMVPPMYGYRTEELGIDDVLNNITSRLQGSHIDDSMMTDWSGKRGSMQGTQHDSIQVLGL